MSFSLVSTGHNKKGVTMNQQNSSIKPTLGRLYTIILLTIIYGFCSAQDVIGFSVGYESFPATKLSGPNAPETLEMGSSSFQFGAAFPMSFKDGKILLMNSLKYKKVNLTYKNDADTLNSPERVSSIEYTAFMIDSLSQKWSLVVALTPGIASDFEGDISSDDFTMQAIFGFMRTYSEKFKLGIGLAYTREFGPSIPMPFVYVDWLINEKLKLNGIVPINLDLAYTVNERIDLGLAFTVSGNRYHGDPDIYNAENPQMEYSEGTLSPKMSIHIVPQWMHLNLEGGYAFYRNYDFLDGDKSAGSYELDPVTYFRISFVLGM